jgi:hypothetical protein
MKHNYDTRASWKSGGCGGTWVGLEHRVLYRAAALPTCTESKTMARCCGAWSMGMECNSMHTTMRQTTKTCSSISARCLYMPQILNSSTSVDLSLVNAVQEQVARIVRLRNKEDDAAHIESSIQFKQKGTAPLVYYVRLGRSQHVCLPLSPPKQQSLYGVWLCTTTHTENPRPRNHTTYSTLHQDLHSVSEQSVEALGSHQGVNVTVAPSETHHMAHCPPARTVPMHSQG